MGLVGSFKNLVWFEQEGGRDKNPRLKIRIDFSIYESRSGRINFEKEGSDPAWVPDAKPDRPSPIGVGPR